MRLEILFLLPLALAFNGGPLLAPTSSGGPLLAPTRHRTVVASAALQEAPSFRSSSRSRSLLALNVT